MRFGERPPLTIATLPRLQRITDDRVAGLIVAIRPDRDLAAGKPEYPSNHSMAGLMYRSTPVRGRANEAGTTIVHLSLEWPPRTIYDLSRRIQRDY